MQKLLREYIDELNKRQKKNRRTGIAVLVLVVVVFGSVMGILTQYGVAMTGKPQCGLEEHTHTEECYEKTLVCGLEEGEGHTHTEECLYPAELTCGLEEGEGHTHTDECLYPAELTCGLEEGEGHTHNEDCYTVPEGYACGLEESEGHTHNEDCYTVPEGYACGLEEGEGHTHSDDCYEETLVCGKEEHIHTEECYMDAGSDEAAVNVEEAVAGDDVEDAAAWDSQYAEVEWKEVWGEDLVTAAQMQIGYQESADNYTEAADGSQKGYTRFGHFAGDMYADWDAAFVNFCLHYAGIKESGYFPEETDTAKWREAFEQIREENAEYLTTPENYIPTAGDIVFFQKENEETDMQMGIVSAVNEDNRTITAIEGNNGNEVKETEYSLDDEHIVNYLMLSNVENAYKNTGDADEATAETEENWAYEESFETENVVIHVKAKEGVVPEGAVLSVTPIEKTEITEDMSEEEAAKAEEINEQYELTNQKLLEESEKKEEVLQGFLAYDICFMVDGQETEPNGEVNVTMDFKEAVKPEGVSEDAAVTVTHLKEDESAEDGIVVEDLTEKEAATVTTAEENASVEKVELVAESFSQFVIQWIEFYNVDLNLSIQYVDENYNSIEGIEEKTSQINANGSRKILKDILPKIISDGEKNYEIVRFEVYEKSVPAQYDNRYEVTEISGNISGYEPKITFYTPSEEQREYSADAFTKFGMMAVRAVLQEKVGVSVTIVDDVINSGAIKAEIKGLGNIEEKDVRYVWYKKIGIEGSFLEVPLKQYEANMANLSEDGKSLYVALDQGALNDAQTFVQYQVKVYKNDTNEPIAESELYDVQYYNSIQNGSFETPEVRAGSYEQVTVENTPGLFWKSTSTQQGPKGPDDITDIKAVEIARVETTTGDDGMSFGKIAPSYEAGSSFFAADGDQFAELNANTTGTLYQDVLTIPGKTLTYQFSHRGRTNSNSGGYDKMYLVILPTRLAETLGENGGTIDTQREVEDLIKNAIGSEVSFNDFDNGKDSEKFAEMYPGGYIKKFVANPNSWTVNSDNYTPADSLTRFFFISAETKPMQGNFLDNISFSQQILKPSNDKVNLRIEKTVKGLAVSSLEELANELEKLEFDIVVKESSSKEVLYIGTVQGTGGEKKINWEFPDDTDEAGTYTGYFNIPEIQIGVGQICTISVTESGGTVAGYKLEVGSSNTVSKAAVNENKTNQMVEVNAGQSVTVSFTNTYTEETEPEPIAEWKMIKCSSTKDSDGKQLNTPPGAEFEVTDMNGDVVATGESGEGGFISWTTSTRESNQGQQPTEWKPKEGTFTITETKAPAGYSIGEPWTVTFTDGVPAIEGITSETSENGDTVIYLENTPVYSLPSTGGSGIFWYMFSGVLLMAGATLFLYKNKVQGGAGKLG